MNSKIMFMNKSTWIMNIQHLNSKTKVLCLWPLQSTLNIQKNNLQHATTWLPCYFTLSYCYFFPKLTPIVVESMLPKLIFMFFQESILNYQENPRTLVCKMTMTPCIIRPICCSMTNQSKGFPHELDITSSLWSHHKC